MRSDLRAFRSFEAFALITLGQQRPEFNQLAVDMLRRRSRGEQIAEHRLTQRGVVEALSCLSASGGSIDRALCLRILEVSWASGSRQTKYIVYTALRDVRKLPFFDVDGMFARSTAIAAPHSRSADEQMSVYSREFKSLFNDAELEAAERRFRLAEISGGAPYASSTSSTVVTLGAGDCNLSPRGAVASPRADSLSGSLDTTSVHSDDLDLNSTAPGAGVRTTD